MSKWAKQPSEQQEAENAAYVWAKCCQSDLGDAVLKFDATSEDGWDALKWHFARLDKAVEKYEIASEMKK